MMRGARRLDERGFGLAAVMMFIAVVMAMGVYGISLQRQEHRTQLRNASRAIAFYAAETGLVRGLESWNTPDVTASGDSWIVDEGVLLGGATYRVEATKLDDASTVQALFVVRSLGRAPHGQTKETALLVATVPFGSPVRGALRTVGKVKVAGRAEVSGLDSIPPAWSEECPPALADAAGITMTDTTRMTRSGAATVSGSPRIDEDTNLAGYFDFGSLPYEDVAAIADIRLPDGSNVSGSLPAASYTPDGECDTADPDNWGDPWTPLGPCGDWFPIIHVAGTLTLSGSGAGQGVLLVDGDLSICGGATFYGPVVVKGSLKSCGSGFRLFGGVVAGESDLNPQGGGMVLGASLVQYSSCVVERAISRSQASRPRPLTERPWFGGR